ncbi:MAG: hypothetical protein NC390_03965 [Fusobacterium sp.]|nr:hypothetical protein [Fusobacterium sp.]
MKKILIIGILLLSTLQAHAGIISKVRNWANTGWDNYGWGNSGYTNCPCYNNGFNNGLHNGHRHHHHGNKFFNNGAITGFTPPINGTVYPTFGNYHSPMYGRFDHLPNGRINSLNSAPAQMFTDFNSNFGTNTGVTIID